MTRRKTTVKTKYYGKKKTAISRPPPPPPAKKHVANPMELAMAMANDNNMSEVKVNETMEVVPTVADGVKPKEVDGSNEDKLMILMAQVDIGGEAPPPADADVDRKQEETEKRGHDDDADAKQGQDKDRDQDAPKKRKKIRAVFHMKGDEEAKDPAQNPTFLVPYEHVEELKMMEFNPNELGNDIKDVKVEVLLSQTELQKDYPSVADGICSAFGAYQVDDPRSLESLKEGRKVKGLLPLEDESCKEVVSDPCVQELVKDVYALEGIVVARAEYGGITALVRIGDLKGLKPREYINDHILDYGIISTLRDLNLETYDKCFLSSLSFNMFWRPLDEPLPDHALKSLYSILMRQSQDILNIKYLVLPFARESHWFLAIVCNPFPDGRDVEEMDRKIADAKAAGAPYQHFVHRLYRNWIQKKGAEPCIMIMDSMSTLLWTSAKNYHIFLIDSMSYVKRALMEILDKHWRETGREHYLNHANVGGLIKIFSLKVAPQHNCWDCGFFVMHYTKVFFQTLRLKGNNYMELAKINFSHGINPGVICCMRLLMEVNIVGTCKQENPEWAPKVAQILAEQKKGKKSFKVPIPVQV